MDRLAPLEHVLRPVEALDRARDFLRDQLGLTELLTLPGLAYFDMGGARLLLRETGEKQDADVLYFGVADILAAYDELIANGVPFTEPPHVVESRDDGSHEWMAFFSDDEGRPLALHAVTPPKEHRN